MNWLNKLLGYTKKQKENDHAAGNGSNIIEPATTTSFCLPGLEAVRFGRYSDNNKSKKKTQSWYAAEDRFKEKNYEAAFTAFFDYLSDEAESNVSFHQNGTSFTFILLQGSKKVHGKCDGKTISASSPLAVMETPRTAVMRRLLEMNYSLYYCHSAIDQGNTLCMVFITDVASANPGKLYYGLRELATKADRQDDLLLADFSSLKPTDHEHTTSLPAHELDVKYKYFRLWIEETLQKVNELNQDSFSGAIAYLLLTLIYRIDFLIVPEAKLLAQMEKINSIYWDKKEETALVERNQMMKDAIRKLLNISKEAFSKSLYNSRSTFSIATPPKAEKVKDHIISANKDASWYIENKYPEIALIINEYGMVYNQFIYSMPKVQADLIKIYMAVMHADFFRELGLTQAFYDPEKKTINKEAITHAVNNALAPFRDKFRYMKWDHEKIDYGKRYDFGVDFSEQLSSMNLETKRD